MPRRGLVGLLAISTACANISTTTTVQVSPRAGEPVRIGDGEISTTHAAAHRWVQLGGDLVVEIEQEKRCRMLLHYPVIRSETLRRKADHTLALEWLITAGLAGFAVFAFVNPGAFGGRVTDQEGNVVVVPEPGYRVGGVFTGMAAIGLAASIYDTWRTRDTVHHADAFRTEPGPAVACREAGDYLARTAVTLVVGQDEIDGRTDERGRVRFRLPPLADFLEGDGTIEPRVIAAAVRISEDQALRVDFRVPYDEDALAHHGDSRTP